MAKRRFNYMIVLFLVWLYFVLIPAPLSPRKKLAPEKAVLKLQIALHAKAKVCSFQ